MNGGDYSAVHTNTQGQQILNRSTKVIQWKKDSLLTNDDGMTVHMQKMIHTHDLMPCKNINLEGYRLKYQSYYRTFRRKYKKSLNDGNALSDMITVL